MRSVSVGVDGSPLILDEPILFSVCPRLIRLRCMLELHMHIKTLNCSAYLAVLQT